MSLRRTLGQPPAPSEVTDKAKYSCSGVYPARLWKPPKMQTGQPLWAAYCHAWWAAGGRTSPLRLVWTPLVCIYVVVFPPRTTAKSAALPSWWLPHRYWASLLGAPKSAFIRLSKPCSPSLSPGAWAPAPDCPTGLCWTCSRLLMYTALFSILSILANT